MSEAELVRDVLDALLRENFGGLADGTSLVDGIPVSIPLRPDGFQCDVAAAAPMIRHGDRPVTTLADVLGVLRGLADPTDRPGFDAFATECRQALATRDTQRAHRAAVLRRLAERPRTGMAGGLYYDALAAYAGHPIYPAGHCRLGIDQADQLRYAPDYAPRFALRWTGVPANRVTAAGTLPDWWPDLGLPDRVAMPVHPLTDPAAAPGDVLVAPTLSMRTVAVLADPRTHLKLPLATSTLGVRNRRTIKPGTLADGALTDRLLAAVLANEPRFADRVLLADEGTFLVTDDELLAVLIRRYPSDVDGSEVVPLAALAAPGPDRTVADDLADRYFAGDRAALLAGYLDLLLDWHVTLLLRYGIALEAHQQNVSLVLDRVAGRTRIRLLYKDNDGPRLRMDRLVAGLGAAPRDSFTDRRIPVTETTPLVDLFITITVHLCAAAILFGLNESVEPVRAGLERALARHPDAPDSALLRDRLFHADRLPVKAMVTAGTLLTKDRSGAADVNKHYRYSGPNYLARTLG